MITAVLLLMLQLPLSHELLQVEDRRDSPARLIAALEAPDPSIRRQAVRALGRFERPELAGEVHPLASDPDPAVRAEAVNALGQMGVAPDFPALLESESNPLVRAVIYRTMGRLPGTDEPLLAAGLAEDDPEVRIGAAHGLGAWLRREPDVTPAAATIEALERAARRDEDVRLRRLAMAALSLRPDAADPETVSSMLDDSDAEVRRLAVAASKTWLGDDPSFQVRYESLRQAPACQRARAALDDRNAHVVLLAIDQLGTLGCDASFIAPLADDPDDWRVASRALIALARAAPWEARERLDRFARHELWALRAAAAQTARILGDEATLDRLIGDPHPRVVAAAIDSHSHGVIALESSDYGVIMAAAGVLEGPGDPAELSALFSALERLSADGAATSRDPRMKLLDRIASIGDGTHSERLRPLLADFDPVIAARAAELLSAWTGRPVRPVNRSYRTEPIPGAAFVHGLEEARAEVTMDDGSVFVLRLLPGEAPVTAARFARLVERGYYDGLTFHRVEPNFVIQGGSPAADEYVGYGPFMRDEVGLTSHERGTVGISTRGRDTGDAQIFINLVDNDRLDHNYTVFADVESGMENVDRILPAATIRSIRILRP